jgi:hypothetical protein
MPLDLQQQNFHKLKVEKDIYMVDPQNNDFRKKDNAGELD